MLDSITLPPTTADNAGFVAQVTALHAAASRLTGRPGDVATPLDAAEELAERFGATGGPTHWDTCSGPTMRDLSGWRMHSKRVNLTER